jgi:hypothetical protein
LLSYVQAEIYDIAYVLTVMATISDLPLTTMSESVHTSLTELLDPGNVNVAFGISCLHRIEAENSSYSRNRCLICVYDSTICI